MGLGAILVESCVMSLSAHIGNQGRGNLLLTFLPTVLLAVPITIVLLPGFTDVLSVPLFLFQTWVCVKVLFPSGRTQGPPGLTGLCISAGRRSVPVAWQAMLDGSVKV